MTNTTNNKTAANNTPAINFRAPIKVHMPVTINFNAPVSLNYNGASEDTADLQRYIATRKPVNIPSSKPEKCDGRNDQVLKSWVSSKPTCSDKPAKCSVPTSKPAPKNSDCTSISTPIRDRADAKKGTGVADQIAGVTESTINDLAESLGNQINLYFDNLRKKIIEMEEGLDCRHTERTPISEHLKEMIKIEGEYLEARLKYLENKKRYGF